jgi:hypothetical protein
LTARRAALRRVSTQPQNWGVGLAVEVGVDVCCACLVFWGGGRGDPERLDCPVLYLPHARMGASLERVQVGRRASTHSWHAAWALSRWRWQ